MQIHKLIAVVAVASLTACSGGEEGSSSTSTSGTTASSTTSSSGATGSSGSTAASSSGGSSTGASGTSGASSGSGTSGGSSGSSGSTGSSCTKATLSSVCAAIDLSSLPSPKLYWGFEGATATAVATEVVGGSPGTPTNATFAADGVVGTGATLTGSGSSIAATTAPRLAGGSFSMWIRASTLNGSSNTSLWAEGSGPAAYTGWGAVLKAGVPAVYVENGTSAGEQLVTATQPICVDEWSHILGVALNGVVKVYVNGVLSTTQNVTANPIVLGTAGLNAGFITSSPSLNLAGKMDEFAAWDVALSDSQAALVYQAGRCGGGLVPVRANPTKN